MNEEMVVGELLDMERKDDTTVVRKDREKNHEVKRIPASDEKVPPFLFSEALELFKKLKKPEHLKFPWDVSPDARIVLCNKVDMELALLLSRKLAPPGTNRSYKEST